ncbi:serine hydrolase [Marinifilum sp. N1E240]|uniref:serine hydrolase domain-containing protein n=1 Tax=Marinifilum sp. N1E240 TaxID=2608082 RepID=UPI00128D4A39|nr:serine hydrolase domain-containing protein [Marinifilum sp. N1E240]MPQ49036.1 serine hydrolase [Marinifilum sp. N1E240]
MKFSILILGIFLIVSCQTHQQKDSDSYNDLKSEIDSIIINSSFNGVVLLTKDTARIYSKAVGYSDIENKIPIKLDDQFVIGSISKQITAVLILREYENGKIKLDDKIDQYLSDIDQTWVKEVTIHQLLTHTHGIVAINKPLEFKQGSRFHYSQLGYELLANILEKVTSKTFNELSTELFNKYGLTHTFHPDNKEFKNLVKGYRETKNGKLKYCSNSLFNYVPAGSFISSVEDLNRWNQYLHSGKLVKKESLELMKTKFATRIHPIFGTVEYGYGLLFKDGEENIQIGALGYAPGFVSACYYYPQSKLNVSVLQNTATNLDDFKKTFKVHTELMELIKKQTPNILNK